MDLKQSNLDEKIKGVISTPKGKGVVAGLVLIIMLLLVLLVVTFAIPQPDNSAELIVNKDVKRSLDKTPEMPVAQKTEKPSNSGTSVNTTGTVDETESIKYSEEIMKFRDPFAPIVESTTTSGNKTVYSASSTGSESSTGSDGSSNGENMDGSDDGSDSGNNSGDTATNTIKLNSIMDDNGTRYGVFAYNGVQYVAAAGDVIGTSSYQVLDVGEGSATLLYGDDRLTISLGEEVIK